MQDKITEPPFFFGAIFGERCRYLLLVDLLLLLPPVVHELGEHVDGEGEDDGGVLLGGDRVEGLETQKQRIYLRKLQNGAMQSIFKHNFMRIKIGSSE